MKTIKFAKIANFGLKLTEEGIVVHNNFQKYSWTHRGRHTTYLLQM